MRPQTVYECHFAAPSSLCARTEVIAREEFRPALPQKTPTSPSVARPLVTSLPARNPDIQGQILAEAKHPNLVPFASNQNQGHSNIAAGDANNCAKREKALQAPGANSILAAINFLAQN